MDGQIMSSTVFDNSPKGNQT